MMEYPHVLLGQDINLVGGKPVSDPALVPALVDDRGWFVTSVERANTREDNPDPYPYDQTVLEVENQVKRFIELTDGGLPGYLKGHSYGTATTMRAISDVAKKYGIPTESDICDKFNIVWLKMDWLKKPVFRFEDQVSCDVENLTIDLIERSVAEGIENMMIVVHAGYLDATLFDYSGYTAIRYNDLKMIQSKKLKQRIEDLGIQLVNDCDFLK